MAKNLTLKDQLCDLLTPAPFIHDSDDDEAAAQVVEKYADDDEKQVQEGPSRLRLLNATLLDEDKKYHGKRISRKELTKFDDEEEDEEESQLEDEDDESDDGSDNDEVDEGSSEDEDEESGEENDEAVAEGSSVNSEVIENFSKMDFNDEFEKGKSTRSQLLLWDSMLECRIKLQKVLQLTNQFPQHDVWPQFITSADSEFKKAHKQGTKAIESVLHKLVTLQTTLLKKYPDTNKNVLENETCKMDADEEIASDTEEEIDEDKQEIDDDKEEMSSVGKKRKISFDEYPEFLSKRHKEFEEFRNSTIQKWNDRTKLTTGKIHTKSFNAFDQTALKQIDQILSDKDRLRRRCQTKRSIYRVLGTSNQDNEDEKIDAEIFDDDDFYQQLLRELIEKRSINVQDPIALGEQLLHIQKLRGKAKKKVDTKASKGRRLRYKVHPKLVNFMASHDTSAMTIEARNDLFNSLFGKTTQKMTQTAV